ncbi:MAG: YfcE family phosphodiesterase [Elusimicrobiota bacterium]|jgi:putative phosphoesterase|nr:YfcE family phosphodiesterase [Elusimicrobiota bacterium]
MLIGVLSDTHNDGGSIQEAIMFFNLRNVDIVLHCGDICLPQYAASFHELHSGFKAVYGNNDFYSTELDRVISQFGIISRQPFKFNLKNKSFIMTHQPPSITTGADFILFGHTHKKKIQKVGQTIILNSGEVCGWRYGIKTVALIYLPDEKGKASNSSLLGWEEKAIKVEIFDLKRKTVVDAI